MFTRIGMDVRWMLGPVAGRTTAVDSCLAQLLLEEHEKHQKSISESQLNQAATFVGLCRQIVLRQYIGEGIMQCYLPDGEELTQTRRAAICKTIERVTGLSSHQSNRLLNGLGLYTTKENVLSTMVMMERRLAAHDGTMQDMDILYPLLLSFGASSRLEQFLLSPYAFAANTASSLLRTRVQTASSDEQKIADAQAEQRRLYPPTDDVKQDLSRRRAMALYGLYLWASGAKHFVHRNYTDDRAGRMATLAAGIRKGWNSAAWIFAGDRVNSLDTLEDLVRPEYLEEKLELVEEVATRVGMAVCGEAPYSRMFED